MHSIVRVLFALAVLAVGFPAESRERLLRRFDWRDGFPVAHINSVAQDAHGFVWVATPGGIVRFDGTVVQRVSREDAAILPGSGDSGIYWRSVPTGELWQADGLSGVPVTGPSGAPVAGVAAGAVATDGALWMLLDGSLWRRDGSTWVPIDPDSTHGATIPAIWPARQGAVLAAIDLDLARIDASGNAIVIPVGEPAEVALELADGRIVTGTRAGNVLEVKSTGTSPLYAAEGPVLDLEVRGDALWVAFQTGIVVLRDDGSPEILTRQDNLPGAGPLLVDRENGVWCCTPRGLIHFPEPETASWSFEFPGAGLAVEASGGRAVFASAEPQRPVVLDLVRDSWEVHAGPEPSSEPSCIDARGVIWTPVPDALVTWGTGAPLGKHAVPGLGQAARCALAKDGARWIGTNVGLVLIDEQGQPRLLPGPSDDGALWTVYESPSGTMFANRVGTGRICEASAEAVRAGRAEWSCVDVPGIDRVVDFLEMPSGAVWAATTRRGVLARADGQWLPLGGNEALATRSMGALEPASSGGIWVVGMGVVNRVVERVDLPEGWEIVETLGAWQGLPSTNIADIAETADGTVWLASAASLIQVPPSARAAPKTPPTVALVSVTVDGEPVAVDLALELPRPLSRLSLRFAGLSYRDPDLLRYRLRLLPDAPWQAPTPEPLFRFAAIAPGIYDVQVEASLDGEHWSSTPARFQFNVPLPVYRRPWLLVLGGGLVAAALFTIARTRLEMRLRLADQRSRIARDLHDQLGSGLASIGLLARVVSRRDIDGGRRTEMSEKIRRVAGELSTSLSDIVWSLKPGEANLASLVAHIEERGTALFPENRPRLELRLPADAPHEELSVDVRRNVLLIALEALHNAARHATAERVILALAAQGRDFVLTITDDGRGLSVPDDTLGPGGFGLAAMRARAQEIRATLTWEALAGGGTEVRLVFSAFPQSDRGLFSSRRGAT